jgi:signal transduction histidine kinase
LPLSRLIVRGNGDQGGTTAMSMATSSIGLAYHDVLEEAQAAWLSERLSTREVLDAIDQGFAIFDENDRLVMANRVYREIFAGIAEIIEPGVPFVTLIRVAAERGQNVEALTDREGWVQERLARHRAASGVYEHKFSDGRWIQVRERRTPLGQIIGTYTDVTPLIRRSEDLAQARDAMHLLSRRMKAMIEASSDWIWTSDALGHVTCEQQQDHVFDAFDPAPHIEQVLRGCAGGFAGVPEVLGGMELPVVSFRGVLHPVEQSDGQRLFLKIQGKALLNDRGGLIGYVGTASDVTEKTRIEQQAAHHTAVLEGTFDSIPEAVVVFSPTLQVVTASRPARDVLRTTLAPNDPIDRLEACIGAEPLRRIVAWAAGRAGRGLSLSDFTAPAGTILIARANFMSTGGFVVTFTDVTEQRRAALMAHQSQKLVALGQLSGGVAHEFNNLLTSIGGFSRMAMQRAEQPETVRDCLAEVVAAADRAAALTRQMLTFSRKDRLEEKTLSAAEIVGSLGKMLKQLLPETVTFTVEVEADVRNGQGCVKVDPAQMSQALMNLVLNARDAMPGGGAVALRLRREVTARGAASVVFVVADTGSGIDPAVLPNIFDPFFTTKEPGKGTGLGLAVVHGTVQRFGGSVEVSSTPRMGTTFTIRLPEAAAAVKPVEAAAPSAPPRHAVGATLMIIEDEAGVRDLVRRTLEGCGYRLLVAHDHASALQALADSAEPPVLLVSDVVLPQRSGPEIAAELRQRCPQMKVLFMSGYIAPDIDGKGLIGEQDPVLVKPFAPDTLCRWVADLLADVPARADSSISILEVS